MKKLLWLSVVLIAVFAAVSLSSCATTQSAQVGFTQACLTYDATFKAVYDARVAGKLNQSQIDNVTLLDSQITPLCHPADEKLPADANAATAKVTAAITTLTVYAGLGIGKTGGALK